MNHMPFPSNENSATYKSLQQESEEPPWKRVTASEQLPIMFQLQYHRGDVVSYAYCDLREIRLHSAGNLQLCVYGMEKYIISIEGRHLTELANLIGMGRIKSLMEMGPRSFEHPEESPAIDKITVERVS